MLPATMMHKLIADCFLVEIDPTFTAPPGTRDLGIVLSGMGFK
jgi:hypothetical protein